MTPDLDRLSAIVIDRLGHESATIWWTTPNPLLGDVTPSELAAWDPDKLSRFVLTLWSEHGPHKRRNRVMMHVFDAGHDCEEPSVRYECRKFHYQTPWLRVSTMREARNQACPNCNTDQP